MSRSRIAGVMLMLTFLLAGSRFASAQEAQVFRYKYNADNPRLVETRMEINQTQNVNGMELKNVIKSREISEYTLQEVDKDQNFRLQSENKLIQADFTIGPLGQYKFDSKAFDNEKASQLGGALTPVYETLTGAVSTVVVSPRGEVVKVEGITELLKGVLEDNPLAGQFAQGGTNEGVKAGLEQLYVKFPEKALKPGDTWEEPFEIKLDGVGTIKGKSTYKYVGPDKVGDVETAKITETAEVTIDVTTKSEGADVTGSLTASNATSTVQFDPARGCVVSQEGKMKLSGNLTVNVGGMTINVQQSQTHDTHVKLLDKLPE